MNQFNKQENKNENSSVRKENYEKINEYDYQHNMIRKYI